MEKLYTLRIDIKYSTLEEILKRTQEIIDICDEALICYEISDVKKKPHLQGYGRYMDDAPGPKGKTYKKIINLIRNKVLSGQSVRGDYSHTAVDDITRYSSYIYKGEDIKFYKNVQEDRFKSIQERHETFKKSKKESTKSPTEDQRFVKWFTENCLDTYKTHVDVQGNQKYYFPQRNLIRNILDFYNLHTKGYKKQVLEHKLHLIYNSIIRYYDEDQFDRYIIYVNREVGRLFEDC